MKPLRNQSQEKQHKAMNVELKKVYLWYRKWGVLYADIDFHLVSLSFISSDGQWEDTRYLA
jgi:hypothetical protein